MSAGFATNISCLHPFVIDQPKAGGDNNKGPNPLEIFLSSLPACICAIGRIIANQKRINLRGIDVEVEGDIDKDFLLGKTSDGRAGFTEIRSFVEEAVFSQPLFHSFSFNAAPVYEFSC